MSMLDFSEKCVVAPYAASDAGHHDMPHLKDVPTPIVLKNFSERYQKAKWHRLNPTENQGE